MGATDTSMVALTKTINSIGEAFEAFKEANDEQLAALKKGDESLAAELQQKLDKINDALTGATKAKKDIEVEIELQRERIEELESRASSPGKTANEKLRDEHKETFVNWMRNKGNSPNDEHKLQDLQRKMVETKDVTIGSTAGGGFAVPEEISREIERLERKFSPVRDLVKVARAGSSDYKELVNIRGGTSGWVGESGTRSATLTPSLRERAPTFGELYAYPQASEWSLDDIFFDVEAWLAEEVATAFAVDEATAVLTGNGTSRPTGMLNTTPTLDPDDGSPLRSAEAYEYVAAPGGSPEFTTFPNFGDYLIDLIYRLKSQYRSMAVWIMNSNTTAVVRKLKDSDGNYLWQPGLQGGQPDRLLGYTISTWEQLDDVGQNNFPIAFGNFRRGYVLADRVGLRITRDNVTNVGFVRFYIRRREGGIILNNEAVKWLRTT